MISISVNNNFKDVKSAIIQNSAFQIFNVYGGIGCGKTLLTEMLIEDEEINKKINVFSFLNNWSNIRYFTDISDRFFNNSNLTPPEFLPTETQFITQKFNDAISTLSISNKAIYLKIEKEIRIDNSFNLNDNGNIKNLENKSRRRILEYSDLLSVECIIIDLLNNFFPINDRFQTLTDYVTNGNKYNILLVLDDFPDFNPNLHHWISIFYSYLNSKKLLDLISYEYRGEDRDLTFSQFFNLTLILNTRIKSKDIHINNYFKIDKFLKNEIKELIILNKLDFNEGEVYELTNNIPLLTLALFENQVNDEKNIAYLAIDSFLKNIPSDYHRLIIFRFIFDNYQGYELFLFPDFRVSGIDLKATELFIKNAVDDDNLNEIIKYFRIVINESFSAEYISKCVTIVTNINELCNDIRKNNLEYLFALSYLKRFDSENVLENIFPENKDELTNFIKNDNDTFFIKNKFTFSVKPEIRKIMEEFNKLADKEHYIDKISKIEELWNDYDTELKERNKYLEKDIVNTKNEIKSYEEEIYKLKENSDQLSLELLNSTNEYNRIISTLEPYEVSSNSSRKYFNFATLIISVGLIFNSDRIAELLFDTSDYFHLVIIFVILSLFLIYLKSIIRIIKTNLKKEELVKLNLNKKKIEKDMISINEKIKDLSADIRAKSIKIEELISHKERLIEQIEINKEKLLESFI